ncbi:lanthionine synthetase C family protein [Aquimarina sp. 2201CG14-23]|uniref:lanthionine synthetase C family protein n=1 Tax=Aquimarina mycalae TaxID=3040073 RepID=UPI002477F7D2|nr:lanthionine synthetase C family protein [Aquimarina sp. 2201CG14-23]MDH7446918.1 lanthionine synthetase C family protein [Aquimarina sp. 2201CG14-23]
MNRDTFYQKLEEINQIIDQSKYEENNIGVLSGLSGIALFKFYYNKFLNNNDHDLGSMLLEQSIASINQGYDYGTYCSGIAGLGWVMDHLEKEEFIEVNLDDLFCDLDEYLFDLMKKDLQRGDYDFLHGGIGYLFYFLNRFENTTSAPAKKNYKTYILESIELLKKGSETDGKTLKWISNISSKNSEKGYNFSLSHGMSSIVGILTKLSQHSAFEEKARPLLEGAVTYILKYQNPDSNGFSLFPSVIHENGHYEYQSRVAWCYGDLGIGIRLWFAGKALQNTSIKDNAIDILKHTAKRTTTAQTLVQDAGLCHGSFGNAQMFSRMYKETHMDVFKDAYDFWLQDGIHKAYHSDGYAGFKQWKAKDTWKKEISLLEGIAGIGLSIIDYLADFETNWDECLMIS